MRALESIRSEIPEAAKDIRLNLLSALEGGALTPAQRWGVAVASAASARQPTLLAAIVEDARREAGAAVVDDALAAASLMAMNNVFYRFRHVVGKESYAQRPARLRMNRLVKPLTQKVDFELFSLAASAINDCEVCVRSHEKAVLEGGLGEDHVHDAVRIAAAVHAAAVALDCAGAARSVAQELAAAV